MRIIFIDNNDDLTSTSINLKALDSLQKILINFAKALKKKNHEVIIYNNTIHQNVEGDVEWKNLKDLNNEVADIVILFQDFELLQHKIKAKLKFFFLHYKPYEKLDNSILVKLIKEKVCILYSNNYVISSLPHNFNYIPKLFFKVGVDDKYILADTLRPISSNVFVNTHPLKGLDWLIEVWLKYIHIKIPWAELHIYSKLLEKNKKSENIKIRNLKLTLEVNNNCGIFIKSPLPQEEFIAQLINYKLHLCPSLDKDFQYLSILESQAFGIPVIARDTASIYNCIYNNETGYIVKDALNFSRKVVQVLNDNRLLNTLKRNAKLNNNVISWKDAVSNFERKLNENSFYR